MRLAINKEYLNVSLNNKHANFVREAVTALLNEFGEDGNIKLTWVDKFKSVSSLVMPDGSSRKGTEYPVRKGFRLSTNFRNEKEITSTMEFTLYDSEKILDGFTEYNPRIYDYTGDESIGKGDMEKIFFMVFVNPHCELLPGKLAKYQNINRKTSYYKVFSNVKHAQKKIADEGRRAKVVYLLTTKDKGIAMEDEKVRELAYAMFIPNAIKEDVDVLRTKLLNKINTKEQFDEFDRLTDNENYLELCGMVQKSVDKKIIVVKHNKNNSYWCYWNSDNESYGDKIIDLRPTESDKERALIKFLSFSTDARNKFMGEYRKATEEPIESSSED